MKTLEPPKTSRLRRLLSGHALQTSEPHGSIPPTRAGRTSTLFPLPAEALLGIAGESHYPKAIHALSRSGARDVTALTLMSEVAEDVPRRDPGRNLRWFEARLVATPENPYDANAVAVFSTHGQVGHLPREAAAEYAKVFTMLRQLGYSGATCPAFLDVDDGYAVLVLSTASVCAPAVNAERRKRAWEAWQGGSDLEAAAERLGFSGVPKLLTAARRHAKECGLSMPPTASDLRQT